MQISHNTFEEVTKFFVSTAVPQCYYIAVRVFTDLSSAIIYPEVMYVREITLYIFRGKLF